MNPTLIYCDLCYQPHRNRKRNGRGELLCNDCRQAAEYWDDLTPEEREADEEAMIAYVDFHEAARSSTGPSPPNPDRDR